MADLDAILKRIKKGAAAEGALQYFGDELKDMERRAADEIEAAIAANDPERRTMVTARWVAIRDLLRRFEKDIKIGLAAQKEL